VKQLDDLANACQPAYKAMTWFLGTTGARIGECCAVNVEDVTKRTTGTGKKQVVRWRVRVRKAKSGKGRDVPIPAKVANMLDLNRPGTEPLFTSGHGTRIDKDHWRSRVFNVAKGSCSLDITPHDLRHTAASLMIRSGATVKDVQNALGHESAKMTLDLYAGWWDDALDDVSDKVNSLLDI